MKSFKEILYSAYLGLCDENDVVPGSQEATYLWKEYTADMNTLNLIEKIEATGSLSE